MLHKAMKYDTVVNSYDIANKYIKYESSDNMLIAVRVKEILN